MASDILTDAEVTNKGHPIPSLDDGWYSFGAALRRASARDGSVAVLCFAGWLFLDSAGCRAAFVALACAHALAAAVESLARAHDAL